MPLSPRGIEQSLVLPPRWPLIQNTGTLYAINDRFVSFSDHLCPLDIAQLEASLPAPTPPPTPQTWDVSAELQKIKPSKACGPDGISPKLVKGFSYEFSTPLTDLLNCSFSEGVVPKRWKKSCSRSHS